MCYYLVVVMLDLQEYLTAQKEAVARSAEKNISYDSALREVVYEREQERKRQEKENDMLLSMMNYAHDGINQLT